MSISIYYSAQRRKALSASEIKNLADIASKYSVDAQIDGFIKTGRGPNWESFHFQVNEKRASIFKKSVVFSGSTKLPDNSEDATWIGVQHWCRCLTELHRLLDTCDWEMSVDGHSILGCSAKLLRSRKIKAMYLSAIGQKRSLDAVSDELSLCPWCLRWLLDEFKLISRKSKCRFLYIPLLLVESLDRRQAGASVAKMRAPEDKNGEVNVALCLLERSRPLNLMGSLLTDATGGSRNFHFAIIGEEMFESIEPLDAYNKNINILIGSGASADLFPTLGLAIKNAKEEWETVETLATRYENNPDKKTALFMHYYNMCILPVQTFNPANVTTEKGKINLENYEVFLKTLLGLLDRRKDLNRKINIFTTNYDGCLAHSADNILMKGSHDFVVNDGTSGFHCKHLHAKNFNTFQCQTGIFERSNYGVPQLNIIHLHGSVYWSKSGDKIEVKYKNDFKNIIHAKTLAKIGKFSDYITTEGGVSSKVPSVSFTSAQRGNFWREYNKLPIVNPTKWKFHETVFEEHYYQMLRFLSYELEKPNSILISFGFSFADEHIRKLVQRSLSNPQLQTFICCYSQSSAESMREEFKLWKNVTIIGPPEGEKLDFTNFNKYIFSLKAEKYEAPEDKDGL